MMMRAETPGGGRGDGGVGGGGGGGRGTEYQQSVIEVSEDSINSIEKVEEWNRTGATNSGNNSSRHLPNGTSSPRENGKKYSGRSTVEFRRLGQCFIDWATAAVGEADRELTCVTLTYYSRGPIYETSAQTTKSLSILCLGHVGTYSPRFLH